VAFGIALCGLAAAGCARTKALPDGTGGAGGSDDVDAAVDAEADQMPPETLGDGDPCTDAAMCTSGQCVDGVCCDSACGDICHSCALEGSKGVCALADVGTDPRDDCPDDRVGTCGRDGVCDGSGACRHYPIGAVCQQQSCAGSTRTNAFRCSDGTCSPTSGQPCDPYQCNPGGNDCLTTCQTNDDCIAGSFCNNGSCGRKPLGAPCTMGDDCNSLICAQGVCCNNDCKGTCESCALTGAAGTCTPVPAGEDPLEQCDEGGRTTCGTDGTCDGKRACRLYVSGTVCQDPTCAGTTGTAQGRCDGAGSCAVGPPVTCGTCTSCVLTSAAAVCMPVAAGMPPVVASQCVDQGAMTCGSDGKCDGAGACQVYPSGTSCATGLCPTGAVLTAPRACNGAGTCAAAVASTCPGGFLCNAAANVCKVSCTVATSAADCVAPNVCTGNVCGSIRVQYQAGNAAASTNSPAPRFQLINLGPATATINLSELTIRYWFTKDGATSEQAVVDFARNSANVPIQANMTTSFTAVTRQGADTFLQFAFTAAAGTLTSALSVQISPRFFSLNPQFGITFTQTGDYSFDASKAAALADWTHVTLYRQGTLIWGIEPPAL
jgi:hypothetical protein